MEQIKLQELVEYLKKYNISKTETLYLMHLYNLKKRAKDTDNNSLSLDDIFRQLSKLNDSLTVAENTKYVAERLNREIMILKKVQQSMETADQAALIEILNELALLSFESDVEIEPHSANEVLKNTLSKGIR